MGLRAVLLRCIGTSTGKQKAAQWRPCGLLNDAGAALLPAMYLT